MGTRIKPPNVDYPLQNLLNGVWALSHGWKRAGCLGKEVGPGHATTAGDEPADPGRSGLGSWGKADHQGRGVRRQGHGLAELEQGVPDTQWGGVPAKSSGWGPGGRWLLVVT